MRLSLGLVTLGLICVVLVVLWQQRREAGSLDNMDSITIERVVNGGAR
jgi:hypothetical protein